MPPSASAPDPLLDAILEIDRALLEAPDPDRVLRLICRRAADLTGAVGAAVVVVDRTGGEGRMVAGCGILDPPDPEPFPLEGTLAQLALDREGCVVDNDLAGSSAALRVAAIAPSASRAVVQVLDIRGDAQGALFCLRTAHEPPFTEREARTLEAFARKAALAIALSRERAMEHEFGLRQEALATRRVEQIRQLQDLHRAGMVIASDLELEDLLGRLVEEARHLCGARYGALGILNPEGTALARFLTRGLTPEEERRMGSHPTGRGLLGAVIREKSSIRVEDPSKDPRSAGVPRHHPHPGPFLGVPIRIRERVFGNLYLMGGEGDPPFSEDDQRILEMLGAQAAAAIDNARLFEETRRLVEELEAARRARNRLHAYVSHDLRNALTGVTLWAERLERIWSPKGNADAPAAGGMADPGEIPARIRRGALHALRLVKDVLDLARLDEGRLATWPRRVVVADLVGAAVEQILPEAERQGVRVRAILPAGALHIVTDQDRALQILLNLLSNAVKASPRGGRVELEACGGAGPDGTEGVALQVRDQGPGIPPERLSSIFGEPPETSPGDESAPEDRRGTGIGLPLSRSLAERLGGSLSVASVPGQGSTFTLWLPGQAAEGREGWIG